MLKGILRLWWQSPLVEQFGVNELHQPLLQPRLLYRRHRLD